MKLSGRGSRKNISLKLCPKYKGVVIKEGSNTDSLSRGVALLFVTGPKKLTKYIQQVLMLALSMTNN
jgi:hypothetical protein